MLVAALLFFGVLVIQNLYFLVSLGELPAKATSKLWTNTIRSTIEIVINVWALLSVKTSAFFLGKNSESSGGEV
jgi:hypothetical protein